MSFPAKLFISDLQLNTNRVLQGETVVIDRDGSVNATSATFSGTSTFSGPIVLGQSTRSGAGAVPLTAPTCLLTTTGANALTLANGVTGQRLTIIMVVDGGDGTLTPAAPLGFSTVTFNAIGDSVTLEWTGSAWAIVGQHSVTVA